ncbi:uncharacterized protein LOC113209650 [Frankliniella occidentalis]|uniref:Uncharacterized protein LOC113209650 n=1 Tax=Frankliniella occidentalis TaxID=133901 RepID=A0A9C6WP63_FRAOC|nr:uncharacterized protein LOC113209650 [Frankliniella occidentalis]
MQTKNVNIQQAEENEVHSSKNAAMSDGLDAAGPRAGLAADLLDALVADGAVAAGGGDAEEQQQRPALPPRTGLAALTTANNNTLVRNNNNNKGLPLWAPDTDPVIYAALPGLLLAEAEGYGPYKPVPPPKPLPASSAQASPPPYRLPPGLSLPGLSPGLSSGLPGTATDSVDLGQEPLTPSPRLLHTHSSKFPVSAALGRSSSRS